MDAKRIIDRLEEAYPGKTEHLVVQIQYNARNQREIIKVMDLRSTISLRTELNRKVDSPLETVITESEKRDDELAAINFLVRDFGQALKDAKPLMTAYA